MNMTTKRTGLQELKSKKLKMYICIKDLASEFWLMYLKISAGLVPNISTQDEKLAFH